MSRNDEAESINFENEQIEQRTLNSDEERKITKIEEAKTFSTIDNLNIKCQKNKSLNKFHKSRLPPIGKSKKGKKLSKDINFFLFITNFFQF